MKARLLGTICAVIYSLSVVATANAALVSRLSGQAAYDTVLDITWVTNAALSGLGSYQDQVDWADDLNYLGFNDWRLASVSVAAGTPTGTTGTGNFPVNCASAAESACRDNELGYMFYQHMNGSAGVDMTGDQTVDSVLLSNIQANYWSSTRYDSSSAFSFPFATGAQGFVTDTAQRYGWAVRDGDVSAVPIPAALWLFSSGLLGLVGIARKKAA